MDSAATHANARHYAVIFLLAAAPLFGDAGSILLRQQSGDIRITAFAAPAPLRVGRADLSVLLQQASTGEPILDAEVNLRLSLPNSLPIHTRATHTNATNKILYAATVTLPTEGHWRLEGDIRARDQNTNFQTDLIVLPTEPPLRTYWPYLALPPAAILLFLLNQRLKRHKLLFL